MSRRSKPLHPAVRRVSHLVEYAASLFVAAVFRAMPVVWASNVSGWLWRKIAPHLYRQKRAMEHLALAFPEKSEAELRAIAVSMWENLGRTVGEAFHMDEFFEGPRFRITNPELVERFRDNAQPAVFCSAHFGNWEIAGVSALRLGISNACVYQKLSNPYVNDWVYRQRLPMYSGGFYEKGAGAARHLLKHVRGGGSLYLLADLREGLGPRVPFFGRPAQTSTFPALVARTLKVPLMVGMNRREAPARTAITFAEVRVPYTDDREADILEATARLQKTLEDFIRRDPDQWMWAHRRWG